MTNILDLSKKLAHEAYASIGLLRKYTFAPYHVHTDAVRDLFLKYLPDETAGAVACDWHDVIEDVFPHNPYYSLDFIRGEFGDVVAGYVFDVTDQYTHAAYPQWNRKLRNQKERERLALVHPVSQSLKVADIIDNTGDIMVNDPEYAPRYIAEKVLTLPYLMNADTKLWAAGVLHLAKLQERLK